MLTSSTLNGALGVHEPAAVAQLGLPKHFVSHGSLLAAAANLRQQQHVHVAPALLPSLAESHRLNRSACINLPYSFETCPTKLSNNHFDAAQPR